MARELLETAREDVPALALRWNRHGAAPPDLLRVALIAGLQEIKPYPIGGPVHAIMMVASALEVSGQLEGAAALRPAVFNLDRVKNSQARDAGGRADWRMPEAVAIEPASTSARLTELERAMDQWNEPVADEMVTALAGQAGQREVFEALWPWAARDFRVIGHKAIFAAQLDRALRRLGWSHGRDALRSLVMGLLDRNPYDSTTPDEAKAILALFEANQDRGHRFREDWDDGVGDHEASFRLCASLRGVEPQQASEAVLTAVNGGVGAAAAWDGVRLRAFELMMRTPTIAGVHPVTSVNALHHIYAASSRESTRRVALLQAAAWMPLFADLLETRHSPRGDPRPIETLDEDALRSERDPFQIRAVKKAGGRAFAAVREQGVEPFMRRSLELLSRKADNDHDYKFAVAALEELQKAHPQCRPYLASASMRYLAGEDRADSDVMRAIADRP